MTASAATATKTTATKRKSRSRKYESYIGSTDRAVDARAREALTTARISLMLKNPFYGNLATRLKLQNADDWLPTAATDARHLFYNSRFITALRPKEVVFLVAHEVLHLVYDHLDRRGDRDPQLWNIAGDYTINADLKRHRVGEFITTVPCLYEVKYDGKSADEIYDDLFKNAEKIDLDGLLDQLLDDHMNDGEGGGEGGESRDGSGGAPAMTDAERQQAKQEMKQAIINAARAAGAGNLPAGVERLIESMTNPTLSWRELIETNLTSAVRSDYSWTRVSRRGWHTEAVMPGMLPEPAIDVHIAIDMSGSITVDQARQFLGEIAGMTEQFPHYTLTVLSFDTAVYNVQRFTSENMDDIREYRPVGGGGTSFECVHQYLKDEGLVPHRLVWFTDGYPGGGWGDENFADTTWIIHGSTSIKPPYGQYAYLDASDL